MKRILVPVDGSEQSIAAVKTVLAERLQGALWIDVVNVQPLFNRHVAGWIGKQQRDAWRAERAQAALGPVREMLEASGVEHGIHMLCGDIGTAIVAAARDLNSDEIVIAASRHSLIGRVASNSLSTRLLEISPVPVRVIPGAAPPAYERFAVPAGLGLVALLILADE